MADSPLRFIRKNGKIIPIRAASGVGRLAKGTVAATQATGAAAAGAALYTAHKHGFKKNPDIKVNRGLELTGLGLSIASGALAAATFSTPKGFAAGHLGAHVIDIAGTSANAASVAGEGNGKERTKQFARQEARNFLIGNAVYGAGVLGFKKNREAAAKYAVKSVQYAKQILDFGRKALRVV